MITIKVCVGSSCYLKGASEVIQCLEQLIDCHGVKHDVVLKGSFCMDRCTDEGVTLKICDHHHQEVAPETVSELFYSEVLGKRKGSG